jgi:CRP/FNR family transcriptional regulator, nitrogen oxide reductase regulator
MAAVDRSLVAKLPLFKRLDAEALDAVLSEAHCIRYPKNTAVFEQGERATSFFVLLHGHVRATKATPAGDQIVVRYVAPGETFGVATAIGLDRYPATATAADDSVVLSWPSSAWPRLVAQHPSLATNTLQVVGSRLQETQTRVLEMSTEQVERRIAHALLRLGNQAGRKVEGGVKIDFPISRQDIAEMTGTTLHTVSRTLSAWEQQGLVESARQSVVLRDPHRLFILAEQASGAREPVKADNDHTHGRDPSSAPLRR